MNKQADWPQGYPFVCKEAFEATHDSQLSIQPGQSGKVHHLGKDESACYIGIHTLKDGVKHGWVPTKAIEIGTKSKYGDWSIVTDMKLTGIPNVSDTASTPSSSDVFSRVLTSLICLILLSDLSNIMSSKITEELEGRIPRAVKAIVKGVKKVPGQMLDLFNQPNFTVQDMIDRGLQVTASNLVGQRGIYVKIYLMADGEYHVYIGYSNSISKRFERYQLGQEAISHQAIMDAAVQTWMLPVCYLDLDDSEIQAFPTGLENITEQCFILLFQTYFRRLLAGKHVAVEPDTSDSEPLVIGRSFLRAEVAKTLTQIYDKAVEGTGWPGGVSRSTFGASDGCNTASPVTEFPTTKLIWSKTVEPGVVEFYRRPFYKVRQHDYTSAKTDTEYTLTTVWQKSVLNEGQKKSDIGSFILPFPAKVEHGPVHGDMVSVVAEISLGDKPHPQAWCRVPGLGCWSDWKEAMRLAFRVEWTKKDGSLRSRYIEVGHLIVAHDATPGSLSSYAQAIALIRYFQQQQAPRPSYNWIPKYGRARVRTATVDMLTQEVRIVESLPEANNFDTVAKSKPFAEWEKELTELGAENVGGGPEGKFPNFASDQGTRKSCDAHYMALRVLAHTITPQVCKAEPGHPDYCVAGYKLYHRPATWTSTRLLARDGVLTPVGRRLADAILCRAPTETETAIEDPGIQELTTLTTSTMSSEDEGEGEGEGENEGEDDD